MACIYMCAFASGIIFYILMLVYFCSCMHWMLVYFCSRMHWFASNELRPFALQHTATHCNTLQHTALVRKQWTEAICLRSYIVYTYIHVHAYTYISICMFMYIYEFICINAYMNMCVYIHKWICTQIFIYAYIYVHEIAVGVHCGYKTSTYIDIYLYIQKIRIYIYASVYIYTYIYIYIHIRIYIQSWMTIKKRQH